MRHTSRRSHHDDGAGLIFESTAHSLQSAIQAVLRFFRKSAVDSNLGALISRRGEICGLAVIAMLAFPVLSYSQTEQPGDELPTMLGSGDDDGYARAETVREFTFPHDHGPHPAFRNEWWYFTGNLETADGRRFGYELTLFRIALPPRPVARESHWASDQIYMGHFAVTDAAAGRFHHFERFARGAIGLAGARAQPFHVWLEDWDIAAGANNDFPWRLRAAADGVALNLELTPRKPVVLHGDRGLSQKSAAPGNASYYYSFTRIASKGRLSIGDETFTLAGESWMDREWSTSALGPEQSGWDWFALQLDDGSDLMFYQLRRKDGGVDPLSAGTWVKPDGATLALSADDVVIETLDWWRSPSDVRYPSRWKLVIKPTATTITVTPIQANQELDLTVRYWEGAVDAAGEREGAPVGGRGYVELAGYGNSD
ncbi:MAG: lipocalin-like domain-containing protein [Gammaproteobacteria bacterium]